MESPKIIFVDGDAIIYSVALNVYDEEVVLSDFLGFEFKFIFEKSDPRPDQEDVKVDADIPNKKARIVFSKKFRNKFGSVNAEKFNILKVDNDLILFSVVGREVANNILSIVINFYLRKQ